MPTKHKTISSRDDCTLDQQRCWDLLDRWQGIHRFGTVVEWGRGISVTTCSDLSTHDFDRLTQLVLLAHAMRVRVEISSAMRHVRIALHARKDHGGTTEGHPGLRDLRSQIDGFLNFFGPEVMQ